MKTLLIKNVQHNGEVVDIFIENGCFKAIEPHIDRISDKVIDAQNMAILPPFYNGHTHAAMTLTRGYADDMPLFQWLHEHIWPLEAQLTTKDIYAGSRLAILEMIKSGSIFFNDMYFEEYETIRAVEEMGVKATIGVTIFENFGEDKLKACFDRLDAYTRPGGLPPGIHVSVAPHAIYTVGEKLFRRCVEYANRKGITLHTHLSETVIEVNDCKQAHGGLTPVEWLDSLGAIQENLVAAHTIHLTPNDIHILSKAKSTLVHNPVSNMKLASGIFKASELLEAGCRIILGTDGCSSNNSLDMREEIKLASLLAKCTSGNPELLPAARFFEKSCKNASKVFGLESGKIEIGKSADCVLINLKNERMVPCYHLLSNWLYSASSESIETVICAGRVLMENRKVPHEDEIIEDAQRTTTHLMKRVKKHL